MLQMTWEKLSDDTMTVKCNKQAMSCELSWQDSYKQDHYKPNK